MVLNIYRQVAFCSSVSRYFDIPIVGFHRQVAPRNQLPVLVDDNVLSILFTPGPYLDVACFGFRLAMYRYHTVIRAQGNIPFCRNCFHIRAVVADGDTSIPSLCYNIYAGLNSFSNINITFSGSHGHAALVRRHGIANRNIPCLRLHRQVLLHRQVFPKGNISLSFCPGIECPFGRYVIGHFQVAVLRGQVCILTGFQFTVLGDDDVLPVFALRIFRIRRFHPDVAGRGRCLAIDFHFTVPAFQGNVLICRYGFHIRPAIPDSDGSFPGLCGYAPVPGGYALLDIDIAGGYIKINIVACSDLSSRAFRIVFKVFVSAVPDSHTPRFGLDIHRTACRNIFSHKDISVIRSHGDVAVYRYVNAKRDTAFIRNIHSQLPFGYRIIGYFDITVVGFQRQVAAGNQFAFVVDDNVLIIFRIPGPHLDIPLFCFCLAEYGNNAVLRVQGNILFCRYRFLIHPVAANEDIPVFVGNAYASVVGNYRLDYIYLAAVGLDRNVLISFHIAVSVISHDNIPGACGQIRFSACRQVFPYKDVAGAR